MFTSNVSQLGCYSMLSVHRSVQTTFEIKNSLQLKLESFYLSFCTVSVHLLVHTMQLVFLKVETNGLFLPLRLELLAVAGKETFSVPRKSAVFSPCSANASAVTLHS